MKNQRFGILDVVSVFGLLVLVLGSITVILSRNIGSPEHSRTKTQAETLAQQILYGGMHGVIMSPDGISDSRAPASVGQSVDDEGFIGTDPWGKKYRYKFLMTKSGEAKALVVWSDGPNAKRETTQEELLRILSYKALNQPFSGDDIGHFVFLQN